MNSRRFLRYSMFILLSMLASLTTLPAAPSTAPSPTVDSPLIREVYVPFDEFNKYTGGENRDGVIMELEEYRALVVKALENAAADKVPVLPPLAATVVSAHYDGILTGKTVRLKATLRVRVAADGWVRCPLGAPLPGLGRVTVDGKPGWILNERPTAPYGAPIKKTSRKSSRALVPPAASLLLHGAGDYHVELTYSVPAVEKQDRWSVEGQLVPAPASRLVLEVPGRALATECTGTRTTEFIDGRTRWIFALGKANSFRVQWQRRQTENENQALLAGEHRLTVLPRPADPRFVWVTEVTIHRQEVESLIFTQPQAARILAVTGPLVKSWEHVENGLRVYLKEPRQGKLRVRFSGTLEVEGGRFVLAPPSLVDAYSNYGYLALVSPRTQNLNIVETTSMTELASGEVPTPQIDALTSGGLEAPESFPVQRLFSFVAADAAVTVQVSVPEPRTESHATYLMQATGDAVGLDGIIRLRVREGKVFRFLLSLPEPWVLRELRETPREGRSVEGYDYEEIGTAENRAVAVHLKRGLGRDELVEFRVRLEYRDFATDASWEQRDLQFALPALRGAQRQRTDLGVVLPPSMDSLTSDLPGWRSLDADEMRKLGLAAALLGKDFLLDRDVVAGLTSDQSEPSAALTLVHRKSRGEYQVVTHILALEERLRVRVDLRLVILDRALDELTLALPREAGSNPVILGADFREVDLDATTGVRTIRFRRPWLGTRHFRIEYEMRHAPGTPVAFPGMELSGDFGRDRFLVLQSRGAVEVKAAPGPGLEPLAMEDVPEYSAAWKEGRLLRAFRYRMQGDPGTLTTVVHERAPVVSRLAPELVLTTIIGKNGLSRTEAEILLGSPQTQYLSVELPVDARPLAVMVDGEPIRAVRPSGEGTSNRLSIPLPSRSYSRVNFSYERPASGREQLRGVMNWGTETWHEAGPRLIGTPVGKTIWKIYHPEGFRFVPAHTNAVVTQTSNVRDVPGNFWSSFLAPLLSGRSPRWTLAESPWIHRPQAAQVSDRYLRNIGKHQNTQNASNAAEIRNTQQGAANQQRLAPRQTATPATEAESGDAPVFAVIPDGHVIRLEKIGGAPEIALSYWTLRWEGAVKRCVWILTMVLSFLLLRRLVSWRLRVLVWAYALIIATCLPIAFGWQSPLVMVPVCEGLVMLAWLTSIALLAKLVVRRWRERRGLQPRMTPGVAAWWIGLTIVTLGFGVAPVYAEEVSRSDAVDNGALDLTPVQPIPWDGVLIPYRPDGAPGKADDKVYVPKQRFLEIWNAAHPEAARSVDEFSERDVLVGSGEYELHVDGDRFRVIASIPVQVFSSDWVSVPLSFEHLKIVTVAVDGRVAGVAVKDGAPRLPLHGRGKKTIRIELAGVVKHHLGAHQLRLRLGVSDAGVLRAHLPPEAKVVLTGANGEGVVKGDARETLLTIDLGREPNLTVAWTFPREEKLVGSRLESLSYSLLSLEPSGLQVRRIERLRVTGRQVTTVEYTVAGTWNITDITGANVSEWSLEPNQDGTGSILKVYFAGPIRAVDLIIHGHAGTSDARQLPTLELVSAARQETYVGLRHSKEKRFLPSSLGGMERVSQAVLTQNFRGQHDADRFYRSYSSGLGEDLETGPAVEESALSTELIAILYPERLLILGRSKYTTARPGSLRHELELPRSWWVHSVKSEHIRFWETIATDDAQKLVVHFNGRAQPGTEITWAAEQRLDALPERLSLPDLRTLRAKTSETTRETILWSFAAIDELDLSAIDTARWESVPLESAAPWLEVPGDVSFRFAYRSRRADTPVTIGARRRTSRLSATSVSFTRVAGDYLYVNTRLVYRIRYAARDRFRLQLPQGAEFLSIDTSNQRSRSVRGTEVELVLQSPITGSHTVDIAYRVARDAGEPPTLTPMTLYDNGDVLDAVDAFVGVLQTGKVLLTEESRRGLSLLETESLPFVPNGVAARNLRPAYRATALDWSLTLEAQEIEQAAGVAAVAKLAQIDSTIGSDGTTRSEAVYTLHNRSLQFLVVELPPGAELWGVTLDGRPVAVGKSASSSTGPDAPMTIEVPIEYVGSAHLDLEVGLRYEQPKFSLSEFQGSIDLQAPRVKNVKVIETLWNVRFPSGYESWYAGGNVRQVTASVQYAKKVENLLAQQDKIVKVAKSSESRRLREQAIQELGRLEQELGDNLAELQQNYGAEAQISVPEQTTQDEMKKQRLLQGKLIQDAQAAQKSLRDVRNRQGGGRQNERSQVEQSFQDTANFSKRGNWRGGKKKSDDPRREKVVAGAPSSENDLDSLLDDAPYTGLRDLKVNRLPSKEVVADEASLDVRGGLPALEVAASLGSLPGLEVRPEEAGGTTLTFHRPGGEAVVEISLRRAGSMTRLGAMVVLLAAAVAAGMLWRRRKWS